MKAVNRESDVDARKYMVVITTLDDSNGAFGRAGCCWNRVGSELELICWNVSFKAGVRRDGKTRKNVTATKIIIKTYRQPTE